ncbi:hypothetical protein L596_021942 [Steinernema carpocapsae]|uniref:Thaumatin-like protein n=1 Tax=Steinernema carpocapsae TaxID=34508 RepID=A0A4U5MKL6_STECR|nr:hypothetical protein L596_021942 [Steinernema carpocapsae]
MLLGLAVCLLAQSLWSQSFESNAEEDCQSGNGHACLKIKNNCPFTIWPGLQGSTIPASGGFELHSGHSRNVYVREGWSNGRIWARTGCDEDMNCETGFCRNDIQCNGAGGELPLLSKSRLPILTLKTITTSMT